MPENNLRKTSYAVWLHKEFQSVKKAANRQNHVLMIGGSFYCSSSHNFHFTKSENAGKACYARVLTYFVEAQDTMLHFLQAGNSGCILASPLPTKQALWEPYCSSLSSIHIHFGLELLVLTALLTSASLSKRFYKILRLSIYLLMHL